MSALGMITVWEDWSVKKLNMKSCVSNNMVSNVTRAGMFLLLLLVFSCSLTGAAPEVSVKRQGVPEETSAGTANLSKIIDFQIKAFEAFEEKGDLDKDGELILELLKGRGEFAELWAGSIAVRRAKKAGTELDEALFPLIEAAAHNELWDTVWMLYQDLTEKGRASDRVLPFAKNAVLQGAQGSIRDLPEVYRTGSCFQRHLALLDSCFAHTLKREPHESIAFVKHLDSYEEFVAACKAYMCKRGRLLKITQAFWRAIDLKQTGDWNRGSLVLFREAHEAKDAEKSHLKKRLLFDDYLPIQDCQIRVGTLRDGPTAAFCKFHGSASEKFPYADDRWLLQYKVPAEIILRALAGGLKEEAAETYIGAVIYLLVHGDGMSIEFANQILAVLESSIHSAYKSLVLEVWISALCRVDFENALSKEQLDRIHRVLLTQVQSDVNPVTSGYSAIALAALHRKTPQKIADVRFSPACILGLEIIVFDRKFQGTTLETEDWIEATLQVIPKGCNFTVEEMYSEYRKFLASSE